MQLKYHLKVLFLFMLGLNVFAQQGINYKALIKDTNGNAISNTNVNIKFIVLQGATTVYEESHNADADANGIVAISIGEGSPISGTFNTINWSADNHFLNVQVDTGDGYQDLGTTAFKAVPYALYAEKAINVSGLEAIDEGNGIGHRLIGRDPSSFGNIGLSAVDLSYAFGFGEENGAKGDYSFAAGTNSSASGNGAVAIGSNAKSTNTSSFAIGSGAEATANTSFAFGNSTATEIGAFALGSFNESSGNVSFAMGISSIASGNGAFAMGSSTTASGDRSMASGQSTEASGTSSTAMGGITRAIGNWSTAFGYDTTALGIYTTAFGRATYARSPYNTAIGRYNIGTGSSAEWVLTDPLFEIGNGTGAEGANRSNAFTVLKSGNIGIKTHTPNARLHITGGEDTGLSSNGYLLLGSGSGENISIDNNEIMARNNGTTSSLFLNNDGGEVVTGGPLNLNRVVTSGVALKVNGDEALWYNGTYFSWGFGGNANYFADNIGINDTTPDARLHINASDDVELNTTNNGLLLLGSNFAKNIAIDNNEIMARDNGAASELRLQENGGNVLVGGAIVQTSDQRLKKDIEDLEYGLPEILKLLPKAYNWKYRKDKEHKSLGLLAQEVQSILPNIVGKNDDSNMLHVNYVELIPILINAIKDQQKLIEKQNKDYKTLSERVDLLEANSGK